jgi:protein-S-isoprenylcysteine O-methyltransferase Ste14
LRRVKRDYESQRHLSPTSSAFGWTLYLTHAALTVVTSHRSRGSLPIGDVRLSVPGGALVLFGVVTFRSGVREFRSFEQASGMETGNLVTSGPYRYSRNPQIVGWLLGLLGVALTYRSFQGLILVAAFLLLHRLYFEIEEQHLERTFGEEYRRYKASTPRFFGFSGNL